MDEALVVGEALRNIAKRVWALQQERVLGAPQRIRHLQTPEGMFLQPAKCREDTHP
jgi:hypothetical protein